MTDPEQLLKEIKGLTSLPLVEWRGEFECKNILIMLGRIKPRDNDFSMIFRDYIAVIDLNKPPIDGARTAYVLTSTNQSFSPVWQLLLTDLAWLDRSYEAIKNHIQWVCDSLDRQPDQALQK